MIETNYTYAATAFSEVANDSFEHHGILDMHWGIRRYQNKDGTLTEAGKRHRAALEKKRAAEKEREERREKAWKEKVDGKIAEGDTGFAKRHFSDLTNKEIDEFTNRGKKLAELNNADKLVTESQSSKTIAAGKRFLSNTSAMAKDVSSLFDSSTNIVKKYKELSPTIEKLFNEKEDDNSKKNK